MFTRLAISSGYSSLSERVGTASEVFGWDSRHSRLQGGDLREPAQHVNHVQLGSRRGHALRLVFIESRQPNEIAVGGRGLGHRRGDTGHARQQRVPRRAETHSFRGVEEQHAADRHVVLELLGDEPIAPGRGLPGDHLGRVAGAVIAQIEQFASRPGSPQSVNARRWQRVESLGRALAPFVVGERRKDEKLDRITKEQAAIEEAVHVRESDAQSLKAQDSGRRGLERVDDLDLSARRDAREQPIAARDRLRRDSRAVFQHQEWNPDWAGVLDRHAHLEGDPRPEHRHFAAALEDVAGHAQSRNGSVGTSMEGSPFIGEPGQERHADQSRHDGDERDDECPDDQHQDGHDQQPAAARGEHVVVRSWLDRLQDGDGVKNVANHVRDRFAFDLRLGPQDEPVSQYGERDGLNVFVCEEVPTFEHRPRTGATEEVQGERAGWRPGPHPGDGGSLRLVGRCTRRANRSRKPRATCVAARG